MHHFLSTEDGGFEADDDSTSDPGGGGVVDELNDGVAPLNDVDVTWWLDLDTVCRSVHSGNLLPAMPATVQWIRLNEVWWTPPQRRQGGPCLLYTSPSPRD